MKFNLQTSKLLYGVRYQNLKVKEGYTFEQLYQDVDGRYFIHFIGGKFSEYGVKINYADYIGREGNYFIDKYDISTWICVSNKFAIKYPKIYSVIDWKQEREDLLMEQISEVELPS